MNGWTTEIKETRETAAVAAWAIAKAANRERHAAQKRGDKKAAQDYSRMKVRAMLRAFNLAPERVTAYTQYWNGQFHLSIKCAGHGGLHLPLSFAVYFGIESDPRPMLNKLGS